MISIDTMFADLERMSAGDRHDWEVAYALAAIEPAPAPPAQPPPVWLSAAVERVVTFLATRWLQLPVFPGIRSLERLGLVRLEHDEAYVLAMVSALGSRSDPEPRLAALRGDEELRESLLWRVFEIEGGGEVSLSNVDKYSGPEATWAECFRTLTADGTLPRERVLAECLRALGRDFSAYRAGFFSQLHTRLAPTPAELTAAQPALVRLLRASVPATVSFAVRQLTVVEKAGALDDDTFVAGCAPALTVPAKGTPIAVIAVAGRIAARRPDLSGPVAEAVATGLEHGHRDVQAAALEVLRRLDAQEAVVARLDLLEPTVARLATAWLGLQSSGQSSGLAAGQSFAQAVAGSAGGAPAVAGRGAETFSQPSGPGTGGPTAGELAAALLAGDTDPERIEQLLAVIAAGTATAELAALAKPARKALNRDGSLRRNIAGLLLGTDLDVRGNLLAARLAEVLAIARGDAKPAVLLATPTAADGWLDPGRLVARLSTLDGEPAHHDLVAALLRVHPDGRPGALRAARDLPGDAGSAVRYALGGPPAPIGDPAVWVAAARARAPLEDDPHLIAAGLDGAGQGRVAVFEVRLTANTHRYEEGGRWRTFTWFEPALEVRPPGGAGGPDQPTVLEPHEQHFHGSELGADWLPWAARIWPHDAEPFFAAEVGEVMAAADGDFTYSTGAVLDALVAHPGRLGPMAATVLAAGLTARELAHRARATEAFAALVPAGRLGAETLAAAMAHLAGHATATRWSAALRAAGTPHAVADVLARLLPRLPHDHQGLHALLSTLHEESVRAGAVPGGDALRDWLAGFPGSSKAARTARAIRAELDGAA